MKKIIFVIAMLSLLNASARACSCQFTPLAQRISEADEIFFATLQRAEIKPGDYPEKWSYIEGTFQSRSVLKGTVSTKEVVLSTGTGNSGCNVPMFVSAKYIVFKTKDQQSIETCSGSSVIEDFQEDEIAAKIRSEIKRQRAKSEKR
ncbi:hypothetical protein [Duganella sp. BuS-21]|uniref:hypothetical protein n=1 Tax=Duganella sp. BuS-21 TaxID=2943848 RepID=UPI0035A73189